MNGIDELVAWLRGVLDETEALAVAASRDDSTTWRVRNHPSDSTMVSAEDGSTVVYDEGSPSDEQGAHIALHDPRSALARIQAERAVLNAHTPDPESVFGYCPFCDGRTPPCPTVRLLAYGHRYDAPGYRDEWKPEEELSAVAWFREVAEGQMDPKRVPSKPGCMTESRAMSDPDDYFRQGEGT